MGNTQQGFVLQGGTLTLKANWRGPTYSKRPAEPAFAGRGPRMKRLANQGSILKHAFASALALGAAVATSTAAMADAGGLSFWLPGLMGSLAAVPGQPGWSWTTMYVHLDVSANGSKNFVIGGSLVAGLQARADGFATGPTYTFATPVLGGQAAFGVFATPGNAGIDIDATLTGPRGRTISGTAHDERTD